MPNEPDCSGVGARSIPAATNGSSGSVCTWASVAKYSSTIRSRSAASTPAKSGRPVTRSMTTAGRSSIHPWMPGTGMPWSWSTCWNRISCSSGNVSTVSVRSPRTQSGTISPSRSTSTNHVGRHRGCWAIDDHATADAALDPLA